MTPAIPGGIGATGSTARAAAAADDTGPAGLSATEAAARLVRHGPNALPNAGPRSGAAILLEVLKEPMLLLLLACGGVYMAIGDLLEAAVLSVSILLVVGIAWFQARRTERALEALRDLSSPRALVVRDGIRVRIAGREVVPGDLLRVAEGDRIAADAVLLNGTSVATDESLLTGESVPVDKHPLPPVAALPAAMGVAGGDGSPFLFSGTVAVRGSGLARVLATGAQTALGQIGAALAAVEEEPTRIQAETARVVRRLAVLGAACSVLVAAIYTAHHAGDWLNGLLAGLTLAIGILPEELPVVLTVFLGLGAWRLSRQNVLTRRVPAIEMLGAATVLCVDKTGTLTENRMALAVLELDGHGFDLREPGKTRAAAALPERFHRLVEYAALASHREPFDPMEKAIRQTLGDLLADTEHVHPGWTLVEEYPLSPELLAMSRVWRAPEGDAFVIAAKGAPEAVADLCHLPPAQREALAARVAALAADGLRVLGVACARFGPAALPGHQHAFEFEFLGLVALADPVRPAVPAALAESRRAGLRTLMITGDHPATALAIARAIGLDTTAGHLTGAELDALDDAALGAAVKRVNVFCRVSPGHKLRLVQALKAGGEIAAMTGDGVNDAPALKAAHIGVAMGGRGTDVAREAAALVLLDDDFGSIVRAVRMGRRIYDNLKKSSRFLLAVHVPVIGLSLLPVLLGWPLLLLPLHVVFLELLIDPACSVIFETEPDAPDLMERPPRALDATLFDPPMLRGALAQGLLVLGAVLGSVLASTLAGGADDAATRRALAFTALIFCNLALIAANRSRTRSAWAMLRVRNPSAWWITMGTLGALAAILATPALRTPFAFGPLSPLQWGWALAAGLLTLAGCELLRRLDLH